MANGSTNTKMIVIVVIAVVAVIAAAAAIALSPGNSENHSLVIKEGETLTDSQLETLKGYAKDDGKVTLTFQTSNYNVTLDSKAILALDKAANPKLDLVATSTLSDNLKAIISNNAKNVDITMGDMTSFGEGKVTVSYKMDIAEGKSPVVSYINSDNKLENVDCEYKNGCVVFSTNHFSKYSLDIANDIYGAQLKVLGNANGDMEITSADADAISALISNGATSALYKIADANNDGVLDQKDIDLVNSIISGAKTTIWHLNYHDTDKNGTMDTELVSTVVPITSAITTGSANTFIFLYTLGIIDEIKGASYGSTNDKWLYSDSYLNTSKVVKLGTSSTTITFEDGKAGSSDVIKEKNVTCVLSDWNNVYLENEAAFEAANIDVVRISAASVDKDVYTNSIMMLGLMFNKVDNAKKLVALYDETMDDINDALKNVSTKKKAIASSTTGNVSSKDSDYTNFIIAAGAEFGLEGYNFGGISSIDVKDNMGIFDTRNYNYDNIVHIRTGLTYGNTESEVAALWAEYANAMNMWSKAYDGQVLVSGAIPVPCRVAYAAYAIYGKEVPELSKDWADNLHNEFAQLYTKSIEGAPNKVLALQGYEYSVTVTDAVTVTTSSGDVVKTGDKFAYGTKLHIAAKEVKEGYILQALGSTVDENGDFIVCNNITARYVDPKVISNLTNAAQKFVETYEGYYMNSGKANTEGDGSITFTLNTYKGKGQTTTKTISFVYYDKAEDAKAAYDKGDATVISKKKTAYSGDAITNLINEGKIDGFSICASNTHSSSTSSYGKYTGSTLYFTAYKGNYVLNVGASYMGQYTFDETMYNMTTDEMNAYFNGEMEKFILAFGEAFAQIA